MFRILKYLAERQGLLTSNLFNERTFDLEFSRDLKRAKKMVVIESPYLTVRRARHFAPLFKKLAKRKIRIRINTRHPSCHSQYMKIQAEKAAKILLENDAKIYTYNDLRHRKLAIIDNRILWEGSMNILSHGRSREIMRRSASIFLCYQVAKFANIYH